MHELLDLGCGTAVLAHYLDENDTYTGVDHDPVALTGAQHGKQGPHARFHQADTVGFLDEHISHADTWNVVVLAGALFHNVDTSTGDLTRRANSVQALALQASSSTAAPSEVDRTALLFSSGGLAQCGGCGRTAPKTRARTLWLYERVRRGSSAR